MYSSESQLRPKIDTIQQIRKYRNSNYYNLKNRHFGYNPCLLYMKYIEMVIQLDYSLKKNKILYTV